MTVLTVAAAVVTAGGQLYQADAQSKGEKYAAQIDQRNAKLSDQARADANRRGENEQLRNWRKQAQRSGALRAQMGGMGLDLSFGTPADIVDDDLMIGMEDSFTIADNTAKEARGFEIEAANYRSSAAMRKANAKAAKTAGYISATGTLLAGASQAAAKMPAKAPAGAKD